MNEEPNKGKFRTSHGCLLIILTLLFIWFSGYLFQISFSYTYYQIDRLIGAVVFSLFMLFILFKGFTDYKAVTIYKDYIKVRWLFGLITIRLEPMQLKQFGQSSVKKSSYIYIKSDKVDLLLNENLIENNIDLIDQLRSWRIKRKDNMPIDELSPVERKLGGIGLMFFGTLLLIYAIITIFTPVSSLDPRTLTSISGYLSEKPEIKKSAKSSSHNIIFHLQEHSQLQFETGSLGYNIINLDSLAQYRRGDKVSFLISKNDLEKKIMQTIEPTFNEKHFSWPLIQVYNIEIEKHSIMSLEKYSDRLLKLRRSNFIGSWVVIGVCIIIFVIGFKEYKKGN